mgnify:CR=1 FL=1
MKKRDKCKKYVSTVNSYKGAFNIHISQNYSSEITFYLFLSFLFIRFNCDFLDAADNDQVHAMLYPSKFQMTIIYISLVRKLPIALQFSSIVQAFEHDIGLGRYEMLQAPSDKVWVDYLKMFYIICCKLQCENRLWLRLHFPHFCKLLTSGRVSEKSHCLIQLISGNFLGVSIVWRSAALNFLQRK